MKITLEQLARATGGELEGDGSFVIEGAAGLAEAGPKDVAFLENPKYAAQVGQSKAGCVFLPMEAKGRVQGGPANRIWTSEPKWAFAQLLREVEAKQNPRPASGVSPKADVHPEARLGANVSIGAFTVVEAGAEIGDNTILGPQVYVGRGAKIGKDCRLYPQVVVREHCEIGHRAIVHSGTVIGSDGYGFSTDMKTGSHRKVPQVGNVVIEDDVEIGSNVSIDRGTTGPTKIGAGTKIDNLVQLGHNVQTGRNCLIVSQVGVSGSTKIGHQVVLAGQAGLVGHITVGDGAIVTAQTGVMADIEPKAVVFGSPSRPHREAMKLQALMNRLPEMYETLKELSKHQKEEIHVR
ncbi:MAG: UDP-3-O-(3-hydroxymyristoyl)glucosamine N-acyltransferase [Elusimicrobia bacterium]|nr:UDP-3-O-(3-hydroxymyristoyl)glucosamine N-acyltransferase [Elusimicrobiota bacterium]